MITTPDPLLEDSPPLDALAVSPDIAHRMLLMAIQALLTDPWAEIREVAQLLEMDEDLGRMALRWANTLILHRRAEPVEDLAAAVRILGFRRIGWLCRTAA